MGMMSHQDPPDFWTQVRQWIGLVAAVGGLLWLIEVGRDIGTIESNVRTNGQNALMIGDRLDKHISDSNSANMKLAEILRTIESRTARLEGIEEASK